MITIARLSRMLKKGFVQEANILARQMGVIERERVFSGASLFRLLVFGWLTQPQGGSSALARFARSLGLRVSKQAIEERFTRQTGAWLLAVLRRAVQCVVCAQAVSIPLLQRFTAGLVEDGSTISLPASLKDVWQGCGGSGPEAALKLTVRWDLLCGSMAGPYVQDGRTHETQSPLREQQMPAGSLWIGDLGYFALIWLAQLVKQGVYFLMGFKEGVTVWNAAGQRVKVLDLLPSDEHETVDLPVALGASKQVQARLIARKMPAEVVKRRREQLKEHAHKHNKPVNERQWEMLQWTIVLTNVPLSLLSAAEALLLMRARGPIELLWKLWKDQGKVDDGRPRAQRILCEPVCQTAGHGRATLGAPALLLG